MESYTVSKALITPDTSQAKLTPKERDERKDNRTMLLGAKAQHAMEFEMRVSRHLRSLGERSHRVCAEVLREILFWEISDHVIRRDFWMYRVYKCDDGCDPDSRGHCCWDAGGFSRRNMDTARRVLVEKYGLLEERRWYGGKVYYRVNHRALIDFLAKMEGTDEADDAPEVTTCICEQDEHSGVCVTSIPDCTFRTVLKQRESTENNSISLTESTPGGEKGLEFRNKESHEGQHDKSSSATNPRESKFLSAGERIARYVHNRLKSEFRYGDGRPFAGLTPVEFSALVKDVNELHDYGPDDGYGYTTPVDIEELYEIADLLVDRFGYRVVDKYEDDKRPYPPRKPNNLLVLAFEAWDNGYDLTEI